MPGPSNSNRVLATIVFTDAVNFSARMQTDESGTLRISKRDLKFIAAKCVEYGGRVLNNTGDGLLMYFTSAGRAIECAIKVQGTFAKAAESAPKDTFLAHRIGIHLGDVFVLADNDVMGDGVNVAARVSPRQDRVARRYLRMGALARPHVKTTTSQSFAFRNSAAA